MGLKNLFFKDEEVKSEKDSKPHVHGAVSKERMNIVEKS